MVNRIVLTLVFTLSFLTYVASEVTTFLQLVPLILFAALVFLKVLCSGSALRAVGSLFEVDGLLYVFFLSVFIVGPSLASSYVKSPGVALLIALCLILARLYMAVVPIREVLEAFFWSGILSMGIFLPVGFAGLMQSMESLARYSPFSFHPNLLAFLLAGYFCVMVWKFITGGWRMKILTGVVGFACLMIIFFASSRAALVGIFVGCLFIAGMEIVRSTRERRKKFIQLGLLTAALLFAIALIIQSSEWTNRAFATVDQVLEITNDYRGVGTGLSGRLDRWNEVMGMFTDGTFLLGRGIRYTDLSATQAIDNSYLVILYEVGLLPLILITWRFISILLKFLRAHFHAVTPQESHFYLACSLFMVVLLVTNIVERYLFGVGNPYSLAAFLLFTAPTWQTEHCLGPSASDRRRLRRLATWRAANSQPSS